jgi:hypothetical protein
LHHWTPLGVAGILFWCKLSLDGKLHHCFSFGVAGIHFGASFDRMLRCTIGFRPVSLESDLVQALVEWKVAQFVFCRPGQDLFWCKVRLNGKMPNLMFNRP